MYTSVKNPATNRHFRLISKLVGFLHATTKKKYDESFDCNCSLVFPVHSLLAIGVVSLILVSHYLVDPVTISNCGTNPRADLQSNRCDLTFSLPRGESDLTLIRSVASCRLSVYLTEK